MNIPGLSELDNAEIERVIVTIPEIEKVWVFGSRAKGNFKPGSDVDLALEGTKVSFQTVRETSLRLNEETYLPYGFDILNLASVENEDLRKHLSRVALLVYERI